MNDLVTFSRQRIEKGSKSFAVAARLFSPNTRDSAYMLYAWCRHCDDVIDDQTLGFSNSSGPADREQALELVEELERKTLAACEGQADEPVFEALKTVCAKHGIPARHPLDLIAGFKMDAQERTYGTIDETLEYCYHVAGVVGVMMAFVMGVREREVLHRASDLGMAFQLTNIARDVVSDHAAGRVYLPENWLHEAGLTRDSLARPENREALSQVVERLLATAEPYYDSLRHGVPHLPFRSAWAVASAGAVYGGIGEMLRRRRAAAWDDRASTSRAKKLSGVVKGLYSALMTRFPGSERAAVSSRNGLWTKPDL